MARNSFFVSLLIFVVAFPLAYSSNIYFAEAASEESHEHEEQSTVAGSAEDMHADKQETAVREEHSSHESEEVVDDVKDHAAGEPKHTHIHEEIEGSHVHNSATAEAAQWVGVGTLLAAVSIFGIKLRTKNITTNYRFVVLTLAVGAGIVHLLLVPDHLADVSIEHAKFFAAAGIAQISFGILFMAKPTKRFAIIGIAGNIGSIILYFVTRIENLPEPFGAPEGIDTVGIVTKIIEMSLVALLIYLAAYKKVKTVEASRT
jgi:hypothetical protein